MKERATMFWRSWFMLYGVVWSWTELDGLPENWVESSYFFRELFRRLMPVFAKAALMRA